MSVALESGQTPYQLWFGKKPNLNHLIFFGYMHMFQMDNGRSFTRKQLSCGSLAKPRLLVITRCGMKKNINVTFVMIWCLMNLISVKAV